MIRGHFVAALLLVPLIAALAWGQQSPPKERDKLPNGKSRQLELIKHDHARSLEDVAAIIALATELEAELEKNTQHVVSLHSLRKAEEIEDLSKKLQKRMKRVY